MRKSSIFVALLFLFVLSACGSSSDVGGLKAGEIIEISYDELIEKLDNEETFLLLSDDLSFEEFKNAGLVEVASDVFEQYSLGTYYVEVPSTVTVSGKIVARNESDTGEEDVEKIEKLMSYTH